jgi:hypothetical protein
MSTKDISEADCWFVIGAYQAGATEKECSDLSGLSRSSAHSIISNFKKLGSPHASALSMNTLLTQSRKLDLQDGKKRQRETNTSRSMTKSLTFFVHFHSKKAH